MSTYTTTTHTAAAATFEYLIDFPYARAGDVRVYLNKAEVDQGGAADEWIYSSSGTKITLGASVGQIDDDLLEIKRVTDISDAATVFTKGAGFTAIDANTVIQQLLYAIDELQFPAYVSTSTMMSSLAVTPFSELTNLGTAPTRYQVRFHCVGADIGYTTGMVVDIQRATASAFTVYFTPTSLVIPGGAAASTFALPHATTNLMTQIDDSKWSLVVTAWR